jgi:RNA polymerase sigma-70 factor (ECF subfamily)
LTIAPLEFRNGLLRTIPQLRAFARAMLRHSDQADDLLQETLLRAWEKQDTLRDGDRMKPWLLAIMRNLLREELRSNNGLTCVQRDADTEWQDAVEGSQVASLELSEAVEALSSLPAHVREPVTLVVINGLSYEEAAAILGCATGTIKSRVSRGRRTLIEMLAGDGGRTVQQPKKLSGPPGGTVRRLEALAPRRNESSL